MEFPAFYNHIQKKVSLSDDQYTQFLSFFKLMRLKKRQFIVQPGFVAQYRTYVLQGALRAYVVGNQGEEYTIQLAIDDWWISDYNSYIHQQPATMFVMAVEDCEVLQIDYQKESELKKLHHLYETFFRVTAERSTAYMQRRIIANLTMTAEERFQEFEEKYSAVSRRMPQYAVASYLGMTTEYLSRLRAKKKTK